jgi:hypothetical protein
MRGRRKQRIELTNEQLTRFPLPLALPLRFQPSRRHTTTAAADAMAGSPHTCQRQRAHTAVISRKQVLIHASVLSQAIVLSRASRA